MKPGSIMWSWHRTVKRTTPWIIFIIIHICLHPLSAYAGSPVALKNISSLKLGLHMDFLTDPSGRLTLSQVRSASHASRFEPSNKESLNFGFSQEAVWVRFTLQNISEASQKFLLETGFPLIDYVDLYSPQPGGTYTVMNAGELVPISERDINNRNSVFPIVVHPHTAQTYYIRYQDMGSVPFSLTLWEPSAFNVYVTNKQYGLGIYYGIMFIILFYNLVLYLMLRSKNYLYYMVYASSYVLWQMVYNGITNEYLWPHHPWITNLITPFLICASGFWALQFSRSFLDTRKYAPALNKVILWLMSAFAGVAILSLIPGFPAALPLSAVFAIFFAPVVLLTSIVCWKRGYRPARYFSIAWFFLLIGTAILGFKSFGLLPSNIITEYAQQAGSILEIALLSLALAYRMNITRQEKEKAQAKTLMIQRQATRELEEKVRERTTELQVSNKQLEILSAKLSKYLAPQIYTSIFSGKTEVKIQSSRKKLTVFFSDIKGFTKLTDSMESEALITLLNDYLNEMAEIAMQYGGTIDKFIGDAIMIFFGDPETKGEKEDALACVEMAIAMRQRMNILRDKWKTLTHRPMRIRMGINTGYCTVGNLGSEDRLDYTIIGGQVNLASRLESQAEPDEILISHETYALIKDTIKCEEKGEIKVKGLAYPVKTYHVFDRYEKMFSSLSTIQEEGDGYSIAVDFSRLSGMAKIKAAASLQKALEHIHITTENSSSEIAQ